MTAKPSTIKRFPENSMTVAEIMQLAEERMIHWNVPKDWTFRFNSLKNYIGYCRYRPKTIELSIHFLNRPVHQIIKTIDHEIAHIFAGNRAGHGPIWQQQMIRMGHNPEVKSVVDREKTGPVFKYGIFHGEKLVKGYHNRPAQKIVDRLPHMWVTGKPQTKGQLVIKQIS